MDKKTRILTADDAQAAQEVFDSQPLVMLAPKLEVDRNYAAVFKAGLQSGCVSFGTFRNENLVAFATFWAWPDAPTSTLVMICNRPTGKVFSGRASGLAEAFDAGLAWLEASGRLAFYAVRADNPRWKHSVVPARLGRVSEYHSNVVEKIPKGQQSRWPQINQRVLGCNPVRTDVKLILSIAPSAGDF